ncbi:phage major capsid protein [Actinomadura barringtoniae]|uniref:Phage major capsid protein n=1 Tax=Actinomadura barringtoniae TaxID=1427535 RepID=A0A939P6C7_9ACTN|nr:family 3 encapsulin nanocompartment shell protein [Actinomadura barringtoniae]MBO2445652.1 phage major capsid protein [Actinomadura barringtoniae]
MSDVRMMLDDPELTRRSPGEEFALAHARRGPDASVELRASISDLFPPAKRRPRLTVRHLLRKAVVDSDEVTVFTERSENTAPDDAAPEWKFEVGAQAVKTQTIRAAVPVPAEILTDPAALAAFVDYRLLVRLGTAENDVLLNGTGPIRGLLRSPGLRHRPEAAEEESAADALLATAALCEWYGGSADGIVMHPDDWWPLVADGAFLERLAVQGVKVSRTRMIPPGTAMVGDFTAAATLLDRRSSTIRLEGDSLVAEIREGLAVHLPGHFVLTSLPGRR